VPAKVKASNHKGRKGIPRGTQSLWGNTGDLYKNAPGRLPRERGARAYV